VSLPVDLPARPAKPRATGRTHAIDTGQGVGWIEDQLAVSGSLVDLAKLGWGTSLVTADLAGKLDAYRRHEVEVCFGGTLFELAYLQGRHLDYADWVADQGVATIEISDGAVEFQGDDKLKLIEMLAGRFTVLSEVGSKDAAAIVSPARWVRAIRAELDAGAAYVILEGRESGTAGLYRQTGEIRMGLVDEIVESGIPLERLVFEAPQKAQQVWLLHTHGPGVNLANIALGDVIPVETLRLGLRADTLVDVHGGDDGGD
jgi:phosphosulfolactate synthase